MNDTRRLFKFLLKVSCCICTFWYCHCEHNAQRNLSSKVSYTPTSQPPRRMKFSCVHLLHLALLLLTMFSFLPWLTRREPSAEHDLADELHEHVDPRAWWCAALASACPSNGLSSIGSHASTNGRTAGLENGAMIWDSQSPLCGTWGLIQANTAGEEYQPTLILCELKTQPTL
jgi:hypothetical protein